ncbi:MAG: oxidoreductase domain protein [Marmoricola sp.]|nr:oxidoreductase domain protein [Marmoricola sp.]
MTRSAVRLGVIGVGDVAQRDYLPEFPRLGDRARLVAVSSRNEHRAKTVAGTFGAERWTTDWREVLADDVDAVLNLTPIAVHAEVTRAALAAGKHVYSEKPLAPDVATGRELADQAAAAGLTVVAAPSIALFPQVRAVAAVLAAGRLGAVHCFRAHAYAGTPPWEGYDGDPHPFFADYGGPLRDMAVYPLHAITALLGPVTAVAAFSRRTRDSFVPADGPFAGQAVPVDSDDDWTLLVRTASGASGPVQVNFCAREAAGPELEVQGEYGTAALSLLDVSQPLRVLASDSGEWVEEPVANERAEGPDHLLGVEEFVDCVASGTAPVLSADHAIHVLDVLAAAEESSRTGRVIVPTTTFDWHPPHRTEG